MKIFNKPGALIKGDIISPILPAGPLKDRDKLKRAISFLEKKGYFVRNYEFKSEYLYLSMNDYERLNEIKKAFNDRDSKIIMGIRGGYGCARLHNFLSFISTLKKFDKILCGFSDLTVILLKLLKMGNVCFYGPMLSSDFAVEKSDFTFSFWEKMLSSPQGYGIFHFPDGWKRLNGGKCEGILTGGCLSLIQTSIGTDWEIETEGKIFAFEDVAEEPYRIDRILTHLIEAGKFSNISGVIVGMIAGSNSIKPTCQEVIAEKLSGLNVPVVIDAPFGHIKDKMTLPLGVKIEFDADRGFINFTEGAVI